MNLKVFEIKALSEIRFFSRSAKNIDRKNFKLENLAEFGGKFKNLMQIEEGKLHETKKSSKKWKILQKLNTKLDVYMGN